MERGNLLTAESKLKLAWRDLGRGGSTSCFVAFNGLLSNQSKRFCSPERFLRVCPVLPNLTDLPCPGDVSDCFFVSDAAMPLSDSDSELLLGWMWRESFILRLSRWASLVDCFWVRPLEAESSSSRPVFDTSFSYASSASGVRRSVGPVRCDASSSAKLFFSSLRDLKIPNRKWFGVVGDSVLEFSDSFDSFDDAPGVRGVEA